MSHDSIITGLIQALASHSARHPAQATIAREFIGFATGEPNCLGRETTAGHFTASALVVSADGLRTLLTHHAKLGRWLQPGGHLDAGEDLATAALREATEETGLSSLMVEGPIFDLDRHWIPARPAEPGHWHYDVRFVVRATCDEQFRISGESLALAWRNIADLAAAPDVDGSLSRMARRWLVETGRCR